MAMHRNEWVENADRWVAGFLEMFEEGCHKMGTAIRDRIQESLRGQQSGEKYLLENGKVDSDDGQEYYDEDDDEEYYDDEEYCDDEEYYQEVYGKEGNSENEKEEKEKDEKEQNVKVE